MKIRNEAGSCPESKSSVGKEVIAGNYWFGCQVDYLPTYLANRSSPVVNKRNENSPALPRGLLLAFVVSFLFFFFFLLSGGQTDGYFPSIKYPSPVPVLYNVNTYVRGSKHCGRVVVTPPFLGDGGWWMISHAFYWNRRWLFIAHACVCN